MNKKIIIIVASIFAFLVILATILFFSNSKNETNNEEEQPEVVEPQNNNSYVKIADSNLTSDKADVHILIKYSLGLYALATDNLGIEGDILYNFGTIEKLTNEENIPINDLETNSKDFYKASIVRYSYDELIINQDDDYYRFYRIGD